MPLKYIELLIVCIVQYQIVKVGVWPITRSFQPTMLYVVTDVLNIQVTVKYSGFFLCVEVHKFICVLRGVATKNTSKSCVHFPRFACVILSIVYFCMLLVSSSAWSVCFLRCSFICSFYKV